MNFPRSGNTAPTTRPLFDWANISGATSYTFQISTSPNFTMLVVNMNLSTSAYTPTLDLPRNTLLYWRVRGNGNKGPGNWSRTRNFYSANPPGVPMPITPSEGLTVASRKPALDWSDSVPAATYYEVQISISETGTFATVLGRGQGGKTNLSQYTVETALDPITLYYWRVRAVSSSAGLLQFSQWSTPRSFRTPP